MLDTLVCNAGSFFDVPFLEMTRERWDKTIALNLTATYFVAQEFAAPTERVIELDGAETTRKVDVRLYTYAGETLLAAARLYQGQTTNFRTPGGGFAPVMVV